MKFGQLIECNWRKGETFLFKSHGESESRRLVLEKVFICSKQEVSTLGLIFLVHLDLDV